MWWFKHVVTNDVQHSSGLLSQISCIFRAIGMCSALEGEAEKAELANSNFNVPKDDEFKKNMQQSNSHTFL